MLLTQGYISITEGSESDEQLICLINPSFSKKNIWSWGADLSSCSYWQTKNGEADVRFMDMQVVCIPKRSILIPIYIEQEHKQIKVCLHKSPYYSFRNGGWDKKFGGEMEDKTIQKMLWRIHWQLSFRTEWAPGQFFLHPTPHLHVIECYRLNMKL